MLITYPTCYKIILILSTAASAVLADLPKIALNSDRQFVEKSTGRVVIFHGSSYVNKNDDMVFVSDESMRIAATEWGMNVARVGFLWNLLEPTKGNYSEEYLKKMEDIVDRFAAHGIYSILDMHQDNWAPQYCGHGFPNFYSEPYNRRWYQRDGLLTFPKPITDPQYAPNDDENFPPVTNCDQITNTSIGWMAPYLTFALGAAAQRMYDNEEHYADRFGDMWAMVANRFKNKTGVLGYELVNEPWVGAAWRHPARWFPKYADQVNLKKFYEGLHQRIREIDNETIIFFESATGGNLPFPSGFTQGPGGPDYNDRQAYSYHVYCAILQVDDDLPGSIWHLLHQELGGEAVLACKLIYELQIRLRMGDMDRMNVGGLLTEFGSINPEDAEEVAGSTAVTNIMDSYLAGWIFWEVTAQPDTDPKLVQFLSRTYAQTISGTPKKMSFDNETGQFNLRYVSGPNSQLPTQIYASQTLHYPNGLQCEIVPSDAATCTPKPEQNMVYVYHKQPGQQIAVSIKNGLDTTSSRQTGSTKKGNPSTNGIPSKFQIVHLHILLLILITFFN